MSKIFEFQVNDDMKKEELERKVIEKLKLTSFDEINSKNVNDFVNDNYDLLTTDIDTISPKVLLNNYYDYIQKTGLTESIKKILKENDDVDQVDLTQMFQDLADIQSSLYDSFARLYAYKGQYMEDQNVMESLSQIRLGISQVVNKIAAVMQKVGLNDVKRV